MALSKDINQPCGTVTSYHRIKDISIKDRVHVDLIVELYVSKETRDAGKKPYSNTHVRLRLENEQVLNNMLYLVAFLYGQLKTLPQFSGSSDI